MRTLSIILVVLALGSVLLALRARFIIEANHLASKSHVAHLVHTDEDVAVLRALDRANDENVAEFNTLYLAGGALLLASSISVYFAWRRRDATRPARSADAAGRSDGRDDGHE